MSNQNIKSKKLIASLLVILLKHEEIIKTIKRVKINQNNYTRLI